MSPLGYPVLIGAALVLGLILLVRRLRDRAFFDVLDRVGRDNVVRIDAAAHCLGLDSRGPDTIQGKGCLCLTTSAIVFQRWLPRQRLEIPLRDIRDIDAATSFHGRERKKRLLRVHFADATDQPDVIAFSVEDVSTWLQALTVPR